jgi:hypothetical protein
LPLQTIAGFHFYLPYLYNPGSDSEKLADEAPPVELRQ